MNNIKNYIKIIDHKRQIIVDRIIGKINYPKFKKVGKVILWLFRLIALLWLILFLFFLLVDKNIDFYLYLSSFLLIGLYWLGIEFTAKTLRFLFKFLILKKFTNLEFITLTKELLVITFFVFLIFVVSFNIDHRLISSNIEGLKSVLHNYLLLFGGTVICIALIKYHLKKTNTPS